MKTKVYSYRFAEEIFEHSNLKILKEEVYNVCNSCPAFMFTGKSENQTTKDVVQQLLNQYIKQKLVSQNWKPEPYITSDSVEDSLRSYSAYYCRPW